MVRRQAGGQAYSRPSGATLVLLARRPTTLIRNELQRTPSRTTIRTTIRTTQDGTTGNQAARIHSRNGLTERICTCLAGKGSGVRIPDAPPQINLKSPPYGGFFDACLAGGHSKRHSI